MYGGHPSGSVRAQAAPGCEVFLISPEGSVERSAEGVNGTTHGDPGTSKPTQQPYHMLNE